MMELFIDGKAKLHIPLLDLQEFNTKSLEKLKSSKAREAINTQAALGYEKFHLLKFFDYTYLWRAIVNLLGFYHHWIGESNAIVDVRIAMEIKMFGEECHSLIQMSGRIKSINSDSRS
ncbi:MAG: hypothetical protein U0X75_27510 [Acidobacteriota bacterium]